MKTIDWSDTKTGFDPGGAFDAFYVARGKPGTGKTTWAAGFPDSLIVDGDPAQGSKYVVGGRAHRVRVTNWAELDGVVKRLEEDARENKDKRTFKRVIIDPAGQVLLMARAEMCKRLGCDEIEAFDHAKVARLFRDTYLRLLNLDYGVTIIDHLIDTRMLVKGGTEKIVEEALLPQSITKFLEQDCHHILTFRLEPVVRDVKNALGKPEKKEVLSFFITTKPGKRTSLANPKARVWLPEVFSDVPQIGNAATLADYWSAKYEDAVSTMRGQLAGPKA